MWVEGRGLQALYQMNCLPSQTLGMFKVPLIWYSSLIIVFTETTDVSINTMDIFKIGQRWEDVLAPLMGF